MTLTSQSHRITTTDNHQLAAFTYGDNCLPPLVLVHGYPDNHAVWEKVIPYLISKFFVIAYDVRGAGESDSPASTTAYRLSQLSQDLQSVTSHLLGDTPFHLAAHDWGSIQCWEAVTDPSLTGKILSFSTLSGPCLDHATLYLRNIKSQPIRWFSIVRKSWYIGVMHLPLIVPKFWQVYSPKQWQHHVQKLENTQAIPINPSVQSDGENGIKLYRANFIARNLQSRQRFANCPVQAIVLTQDKYVSPAYIDAMPQWVKNFSRVEVNSNHWGILSQPEAIATHISDFASQLVS